MANFPRASARTLEVCLRGVKQQKQAKSSAVTRPKKTSEERSCFRQTTPNTSSVANPTLSLPRRPIQNP
jgi:hypothetical protein